MRWARLILAVSLLVGWTSAAAAECAWVFWEETQESVVDPTTPPTFLAEWKRHNAYNALEECELAKARVWTYTAKRWKKEKETSPALQEIGEVPGEYLSLVFRQKSGHQATYTHRYLCLPDTIDPREKK